MAGNFYVTDFTTQGTDQYANAQSSARVPYNQTQVVAISSSSAATTNAISNNSTLVRLHNDGVQPVNIAFGAAPTAVLNTTPRMAANQTEYFTVPLNSGFKVAVVIGS
jgi:hypothetical protein